VVLASSTVRVIGARSGCIALNPRSDHQPPMADCRGIVAGKTSTGVLVFCLLLGATAWAQDAYPRGRIIGSVEIPALFDETSKKSSNRRTSVTLHSRPSDGAPPVVVVKDRTVFEALEHGYEESSVGVLEISWQNNERWYLVQTRTVIEQTKDGYPRMTRGLSVFF
jgi:hypothetical protein